VKTVKGLFAAAGALVSCVLSPGVELLWGQRENKNGEAASDTRVQFSAKYAF
jgi:hypothetical protein